MEFRSKHIISNSVRENLFNIKKKSESKLMKNHTVVNNSTNESEPEAAICKHEARGNVPQTRCGWLSTVKSTVHSTPLRKRKRFSNWKNLENAGFSFSCGGKTF